MWLVFNFSRKCQSSGQIWCTACFYMACVLRIVLMFQMVGGKIKIRIFCDILKFCDIQILVSVNTFL
jgi:hypothetical protein